MDLTVTLHASEIGRFTRCERGAVDRAAAPAAAPEAEHIAGWVGSAVHADVLGEPEPPLPDRVKFDAKTPTLMVARYQVKRMAAKLGKWIERQRWEIIRREYGREAVLLDDTPWLSIAGRTDLEVLDEGLQTNIIDIKTGGGIQAAWLQLGIYGLLHEQSEDDRGIAGSLSTLHFPRVRIGEELPVPVLDTRPAAPVMKDALAVLKRTMRLLENPEAAIPSPGTWCEWCPVATCAVRALNSKR